jgi:CO/xanthine dehydrogenase FAD-binding subunit
MEAFAYVAPPKLDEVLAELARRVQAGERAQLLAGGTDLLVQMRSVDKTPRAIVDIKKLPETNVLNIGEETVEIGAALPGAALTPDSRLTGLYPGLMEALDLIGSMQIQGRASLGGNLCNASPAGDTIPALIAVGAQCRIAGLDQQGQVQYRELPVESFVVGVGRNALAPGEVLLSLRIPRPSAVTADAYLRFTPRTEMDIAVAGAGVSVTLDAQGICQAARVGIGAVAPTALLVPEAAKALVGSKLDDEALARAAAACSVAAQPISDKRGTADYRRHVVGVLCKRAARIATDRARQKLQESQ